MALATGDTSAAADFLNRAADTQVVDESVDGLEWIVRNGFDDDALREPALAAVRQRLLDSMGIVEVPWE
jgi:hypothetical protein